MDQFVSTPVLSIRQKRKNPIALIDYNIDSPRFSVHNPAHLQQGIEYLKEQGYAVFSDVLTPEEITSNIDLFWEYLENMPAPYEIKRDNAETWNIAWPGLTHVGIMPGEGIAHSQFMWSIRGNPHMKKIFAQIWNTTELLVSFDAAGCFRDWRLNPTWKTISGWYHCDQNPVHKPNRCSIQGFVSLTDNNEFSGGLIVVPESHKHFDELRSLARTDRGRANFVRVRINHPLLKQFQPRLVKCKAGDLVVFDSRSIHCNTHALDTNNDMREASNMNEKKCPRLLRIVAYICMSPTAMVLSDQLEEFRKTREELVKNRIPCTHWPSELNIPGEPISVGKQPLKLSMYQRSLIVGTNIDSDDPMAGEVIDV